MRRLNIFRVVLQQPLRIAGIGDDVVAIIVVGLEALLFISKRDVQGNRLWYTGYACFPGSRNV